MKKSTKNKFHMILSILLVACNEPPVETEKQTSTTSILGTWKYVNDSYCTEYMVNSTQSIPTSSLSSDGYFLLDNTPSDTIRYLFSNFPHNSAQTHRLQGSTHRSDPEREHHVDLDISYSDADTSSNIWVIHPDTSFSNGWDEKYYEAKTLSFNWASDNLVFTLYPSAFYLKRKKTTSGFVNCDDSSEVIWLEGQFEYSSFQVLGDEEISLCTKSNRFQDEPAVFYSFGDDSIGLENGVPVSPWTVYVIQESGVVDTLTHGSWFLLFDQLYWLDANKQWSNQDPPPDFEKWDMIFIGDSLILEKTILDCASETGIINPNCASFYENYYGFLPGSLVQYEYNNQIKFVRIIDSLGI